VSRILTVRIARMLFRRPPAKSFLVFAGTSPGAGVSWKRRLGMLALTWTETVREAIDVMREYAVSQLPVLKAEPPVVTGEVAGSIAEADLLDALYSGKAQLHETVEKHMGPSLPMIGGGQPVAEAVAALAKAGAAMVLIDGKPAGVLTRQDLLHHIP
jgi:predicted transcriptional regulator